MDEDIDDGKREVETVNVRNFLTSRIQEINSLSVQIASSGNVPSSKGLAFQHVPKHMRRRAVSHNVKRLPKRLQSVHRSQVEKSGGPVKKPKRPSRKYRRRKSNLLEEYNRRQREFKWLETHIWHAKRFHMEQRWGYKIPVSPTDKGYRALYRAAKSFCAMRDISFLSCLEIEGSFDLISTKISEAFAPSECNPLRISAEMYRTGQRQGSLYFYKNRAYPYGYIGRVPFQWRNDSKALWLWVHPAIKEQVIEELCEEFDLDKELEWKKTKSEDVMMEVDLPKGVQKMSLDEVKLEPKMLGKRPKWRNDSLNIVMCDLEGVFNRIRLYGPLATRTLKETLEILTVDQFQFAKEVPTPSTSRGLGTDLEQNRPWWMEHYSSTEGQKLVEEQAQLWDSLESYHEVPRNVIIPLTVRDPRIIIPLVRTKPQHEVRLITGEEGTVDGEKDSQEQMDLTSSEDTEGSAFSRNLEKVGERNCALKSPLESPEIRKRLVGEKMSDVVFNKKRSELLIPGSKLGLGMEENKVPIILIHRPNSVTGSFQNGGWDVIVPAGWALSFWIAFSFRCVRACGFRDAFHYEFEAGSIHVANEDAFTHHPDTIQGTEEASSKEQSEKELYFRYSPSKRENLTKLKCPFPFKIDWNLLLKFNATGDDDTCHSTSNSCYVVRNTLFLNQLREFIFGRRVSQLVHPVLDQNRSLVGVRLVIRGKGVIESGAAICIPTRKDMESIGNIEEASVEETPGDDTKSHQLREELKTKHKTFISQLRNKRRRVKTKDLPEVEHNERIKKLKEDSKVVSEFYNEEMARLWLPLDAEEVLASMNREPIGFIEYGADSYFIGRSSGLGFCTLMGLIKLRNLMNDYWSSCKANRKGLVLVRNCRNSLVYRLAKLEICELTC